MEEGGRLFVRWSKNMHVYTETVFVKVVCNYNGILASCYLGKENKGNLNKGSKKKKENKLF